MGFCKWGLGWKNKGIHDEHLPSSPGLGNAFRFSSSHGTILYERFTIKFSTILPSLGQQNPQSETPAPFTGSGYEGGPFGMKPKVPTSRTRPQACYGTGQLSKQCTFRTYVVFCRYALMASNLTCLLTLHFFGDNLDTEMRNEFYLLGTCVLSGNTHILIGLYPPIMGRKNGECYSPLHELHFPAGTSTDGLNAGSFTGISRSGTRRYAHNPYKFYGPLRRILLAIYTRFLVGLWGRGVCIMRWGSLLSTCSTAPCRIQGVDARSQDWGELRCANTFVTNTPQSAQLNGGTQRSGPPRNRVRDKTRAVGSGSLSQLAPPPSTVISPSHYNERLFSTNDANLFGVWDFDFDED
ncbi:hypothetical protein J6590_021135 [Homalodisca vitripennis]|nr:hypothetical protein J6590_021135 [Homalodisca vitripennis]